MQVESHAWESPSTGASMPLVRFGRRGAPLLYLPTSGGDHTEFQRYGMPQDCAEWIDAGHVQIFSVDGRGPQSLFNDAIGPAERMRRYASVERYVADEVLPWIRSRTGASAIGVVGVSYGAFLAANLLFKHYLNVDVACGLGGVYGMWHRLEGFHDDEVYFHTPLEYLPRLENGAILEGIRRTQGLFMYAAENDPWLSSTHRLQQVLRGKALPHATEVWPAPADHHEHWWKQQLRAFLERRYR